MKETLAMVDAPGPRGFCAGIVLWDDTVVEAAPVVRYMAKKHWSRAQVRRYCADRGWKVFVVHELQRARP